MVDLFSTIISKLSDATPDTLAWGMIITAAAAFFHLLVSPPAPYGRYSGTRTGFGAMIDGRIAWFTQELWSFAVPAVWIACFATPQQLARLLESQQNTIVIAAFLAHYFYRDLIYPFRMKGAKPTPLIVWLSACVFCLYNGYMQTSYFLNYAPSRKVGLTDPHFVIGMSLWLFGWLLNIQSDNILLSLRKSRGDGGYKIPRGGAFEYVSAANYFGEITEWTGWAIAAWSLPAAAFAIFTFANLVPRLVYADLCFSFVFFLYKASVGIFYLLNGGLFFCLQSNPASQMVQGTFPSLPEE